MIPSILEENSGKNKLPSTMTPEEQKELRDHLDRSNKELLFYNVKNKKVQYTKNMVTLYSPAWWDEMNALLHGEDRELKKVAFQEFNKLQMKILPTEITGADGEELVIKIVDYAAKPVIDAISETIEAEEIKNNDDGNTGT